MTIIKNSCLTLITLSILFISTNSFAIPIDWNGAVIFDSTMLDNFRGIDSTIDNSSANLGTQEVGFNGKQSSSFQSYLMRLNPVLIINDSTSVFGEFTTGYGRGGFMGDSSIQAKKTDWGNALYLHNTTDTTANSLNVTKLYATLYSDTLTYIIGRHAKHWGMGAVLDSGDDLWDRHASIRDGLTMELKIGSFSIAPYWAKISSENSLTDSTKAKEYGINVLYDNTARDLTFGIHYSKKSNASGNESFQTNLTHTGTTSATAYNFGETNVKLIDLYFRKAFGPLNFGVEFPLISGEIGDIYNNNQSTKFKAKAVIIESEYNFNEAWKVELDLGHIDGDSGSRSSFEAMFLNPNYQIANILFRYNMNAINDRSQSIYDSYITNAKYLRFAGTYSSPKWIVNGAFIYAKANEVAKGGGIEAYNHTTNKIFTSNVEQKDDLGFEIDLNLTYKWSDEVKIGFASGYHFTGDYYAYTNDSSITNKTENIFMGQMKVGIDF